MSQGITIKAADLLNGAADRIEPPGAWVRRRAGENRAGQYCHPIAPDACRWCASGAVHREAWEALPPGEDRRQRAGALYGLVRVALRNRSSMDSVGALTLFNDSPHATAEQVAAELRRRARLLGDLELAA